VPPVQQKIPGRAVDYIPTKEFGQAREKTELNEPVAFPAQSHFDYPFHPSCPICHGKGDFHEVPASEERPAGCRDTLLHPGGLNVFGALAMNKVVSCGGKSRSGSSGSMAMEIQKGDRVLVNVAPFIGSIMRSNESIPCEVLDVNGIQVQVRAELPYRDVSLWILSSWIDGRLQQKQELLASLGMAD
jgi:hypothetical protein